MLLLVGELGPKFVDLVLFDSSRQCILCILTAVASQFVLMLLSFDLSKPERGKWQLENLTCSPLA
jgi:hypothetical protein